MAAYIIFDVEVTDLIYSDYRFGTGLDDGDFVKGVLTRIR